MINEQCITLAIRQFKCQNSISITIDNVYTNIEENSTILLSFGYALEIISFNSNSVTINIFNDVLLERVSFNIPYNSYKYFDLPLFNGTYTVLIGINRNIDSCPCPCLCPNIRR